MIYAVIRPVPLPGKLVHGKDLPTPTCICRGDQQEEVGGAGGYLLYICVPTLEAALNLQTMKITRKIHSAESDLWPKLKRFGLC